MFINRFINTPIEYAKIEDYSHLGLLTISLYVLCNVHIIKEYFVTSIILCMYMFCDLFFLPTHKLDMICHHITSFCQIAISIMAIDFQRGVGSINRLFLMETSNIFMVTTYFLKKYKCEEYIQIISNSLFVITFVYYRIYNFHNNVILNENFINCLVPMNPTLEIIVWTALRIQHYGLFYLNLYWFVIILKILYKSLLKHLTVKNAEQVLKYSYFLCVASTIGTYTLYASENQKEIYGTYYLFDVCANGLLSMTSYQFHNFITNNLDKNNDLNKATISFRNYLFQDIIILQGRALTQFYIHLNIHNLFDRFRYLFYFQCVFASVLCILVHKIYSTLIYKKEYFSINRVNEQTKMLDMLLGSNAFFCIIYSVLGVWNSNTAVCMFTNLYLLFLTTTTKPFYNMNHLMIHIGMIPMNYFLALSNIP